MKVLRILPIAALLLLSVSPTTAGPGDAPAEPEPAFESSEIDFVRMDASEDLDPHSTAYGGDARIIEQLYESLVRPSDSRPLTWEPCLATEWMISDDATEYTYTIRKGVRFHDGAALNAEAVVRSLKRLLGDEVDSAPSVSPYGEFLSHVESIEAVNEYAVTLKLGKADPELNSFLGIFCGAIISPKALDKAAEVDDPFERSRWLTKNPVGTGPFKLDSYEEHGDSIRLAANTEYWDGCPKTEYINIETASGWKQRLETIEKGRAHLVDSPDPRELAALRTHDDLRVVEVPSCNLSYLSMNCSEEDGRATADRTTSGSHRAGD